MKRCATIVAFLMIALLVPAPAGAQISISFSEFQALITNSTRINHSGNYSAPVAVNLGSPSGASQTFDLSAVPAPDNVFTLGQTFSDPTGQPGASNFPGATMCTSVIDSTSLPGAVITFVQYYLLQADGFYILGQYSRTYFPPFIDEVYVETYRPMRLLIPLPLAYGTARTAVDTVDTDGGDTYVRTTDIAVDGWGDITFPLWTAGSALPKIAVVPCLRAIETEVTDFYSGGVFQSSEKYVSVTFITEDGSLLIAEQNDTAYTGGVAQVVSMDYSADEAATDVRQTSPAVPEEYALSQNYPNPFNPSTSIAFTIPTADHVRLTVYDLLGREVATLVDRQMGPGAYEATFDAAGLPSGMYLYRLASGSFVRTMKLSVVK